MMKTGPCKSRRYVVFLLALFSGMAFHEGALWTKSLVVPLLSIIMTLFSMDIPDQFFRTAHAFIFQSLIGVFMTYLILGNAMIALSALLIRQETLWIGFVILALTPPAIAIIPFAVGHKEDIPGSWSSLIGSYIGAAFIMPIMLFVLLGPGVYHHPQSVSLILYLIVLPIFLSRLLIRLNLNEAIGPFIGHATDWGFGVILFTMVGLNRNLVIAQPLTLLPIVVILTVTTFLIGILIEKIGTFLHIKRESIDGLVLLGSLKNSSLAGGIALTLFSKEAALPAAVSSVFLILYLIWRDIRRLFMKSSARGNAP